MKTRILIVVLIGISSCLMAQSGEIRGNLFFEETGKPVELASISVVDGISGMGTMSDLDGSFKIKPLPPGVYNIEIYYMGLRTEKIVGIRVYSNQITFLDDLYMVQEANLIEGDFTVIRYKEKLIDPGLPSKMVVGSDKIIKMPGPKNAVSLAKNLQSDILVENNQMIIRGSRPGSSAVFVDGVKVRDETSSVPAMMIGSVEVYTGGIPAKYGDVTGGVVIINTKSYFDLVNERRGSER